MCAFINNDILTIKIFFFFFNDTATTEIYTLSLHDALPISLRETILDGEAIALRAPPDGTPLPFQVTMRRFGRSEEHTSELQSQSNLVCRLLLEKKNYNIMPVIYKQLTKNT